MDTSKVHNDDAHAGTLCKIYSDTNVVVYSRWNFSTDGMDITFGAYYNSNGDKIIEKMDTVVKPERVNSHIVPEYGSVACDKAGTCK